MYEGIRNDVIQGASRLREVVVKYVEENKKQLEYGDLLSDALPSILY